MTWAGRTKDAFDSARDSSKQVLTLTTAVLTLTITFTDKIVGVEELTSADTARLRTAWAIYGLSVLAGIWTLLALTGSTGATENVTINDRNIKYPAVAQMLTFSGGTLTFIILAAYAL